MSKGGFLIEKKLMLPFQSAPGLSHHTFSRFFALNILICSYYIFRTKHCGQFGPFCCFERRTDIYLYTGVVLVVALFNLYARRAIPFVSE
jgi:hypothetical protein